MAAAGPLAVKRNATQHLLHDEVMQAARNAGLPVSEDIHVEEEGVARGELTIDEHGNRASTYAAYLKPAMVAPQPRGRHRCALVERVLVENGRATGIALHHARASGTRPARSREVILSGGSYNSPQLLHALGHRPGRGLARATASRSYTTCRASAATSPSIRASRWNMPRRAR